MAPFAAFRAVWFFYFASIGLFNPYAPLWFKDLGFSTLAIGAIVSLQSWTRVLAPYGWGWLGDHGDRSRFVQLAALASLLSAAALLWAQGYAAVATCTVLLFLANGGVVPLSEAALATQLSRGGEMDTTRYGRVRVWGSIGFICAVVGAGVLLQAFGIGLFPWLATGMFGLLLAAAWQLPAAPAERAGTSAAGSVWAVLRQPQVAWAFASIACTVLAHTSFYGFFSLYLDSLGYPKSAVGALWAVSVLAEIVFFWFQGALFGRLSALRWLGWAAGVAALRCVLTAGAGAWAPVLVLAQALHVISFAAHHAACIVLVHRYFAGPLRGRGQALYTVLGYGVPGVLGGVGGGWLSTRFGFSAIFWAAAVAGLLGLLCARRAERHAAG